ncbi:hypothetical protein GOV10_06240, partial [Candidatus Woesearchaeota archaeon]|nr:hypothetical protein [Candidatus Woesearchaeota archaeon]
YRSLKDRLNKGDELAQVFTNEYEDREAEEGGTYFYSVAARDEAGNTGPFGEVVVATLTPTALRTSDTERAYYIDETLAKIDVAITNIETESKTLSNTNDELQVLVIEKAGLLTQLEKKSSELRISRDELATIGSDLSEEEFQIKLDVINVELASVNTIIPKRITIVGSVTYEQASDTKTQNLLIAKAEYIFSTDLESATLRSAYQDEVQQLMDVVRVDTTLMTANVLFADRSEKDYVYVEKQVLLPRQQEPLALIEYIPKTVIDDADLIQWDPLPVIVERDPIVKYTIPSG